MITRRWESQKDMITRQWGSQKRHENKTMRKSKRHDNKAMRKSKRHDIDTMRKSIESSPESGYHHQWQCCQLLWELQKPHSVKEGRSRKRIIWKSFNHLLIVHQKSSPADCSSKAQQFCDKLRCQSPPESCHWDLGNWQFETVHPKKSYRDNK